MKKLTKIKMLCSMLIGTGLLVSAGVAATNNVSADTALNADAFEMVSGASVRLSDPYGIRFKVRIGENEYDKIMDNTDASVTQKVVGMYIVPASYVNEDEGNYHQTLSKKSEVVFYDSKNAEVENNIYDGGDGYYYANGVLGNLKFQNYGREFMGIAYVATTTSSVTTYKFAEFNLEDTARAATYVASAAYYDYPSSQAVLADYVHGAYLSDEKGVTYVESPIDGAVYKTETAEYESISDAVDALCNFNVKLSADTVEMFAAEEQTLTASLKDGDADTGLDVVYNWKSSDESVVTVKDGKLLAIGEGTATVTASVIGYEKTCTVTVKEDNREVQTLAAVDYDVTAGGDLKLSGLNGTGEMTSVLATKGEQTVNLTETATLDGDTVTIAEAAAKALEVGIWTFAVDTATTKATAEVTVATYVISNYTEFRAFHVAAGAARSGDNKDYAEATKAWYVVLDDDFDCLGSATTMLANAYNKNTRTNFEGVLDGRGHVIDKLTINRALFYRLEGTIKNVAFTNCEQVNTSKTECSFIAVGRGTISNVYLQEMVAMYPLTLKNTLNLNNVVLDITHTTDNPAYVFTALDADEYTNVGTEETPVYTTNDIYVIANTTVDGGTLAFSQDTQAADTSKLIYANADALEADKNAEGKMFDSEAGWASYWRIGAGEGEDADKYGIWFGNTLVESLTQAQ